MGRKTRTDQIDNTTRGRKLGPKQRVDITTLEDCARREEIIAFATRIQALAAVQEQDGALPDDLRHMAAAAVSMREDELQQKIDHFIAYHTHFPSEHPANAFTPVQVKTDRSAERTPKTLTQGPAQIRRRSHINSVVDPHQRQRYMDEANAYQRLNAEEARYGRVLPGSLTAVANELGVTRDWVEKRRKALRTYHEEYPDDPLGTSVVPLPRGPQKGRLQGGRTQDAAAARRAEIIRDIEDAYINLMWYTRDGDANHSTAQYSLVKDNRLGPRLIYQLMQKKYGDIISETTVWRIITDFAQRYPTRVHAAREDINDARQNYFPHIDNDVPGPGIRIQLDIRPLPRRVRLDGMVDTTVYVAWAIDDDSGAVLAWSIIPRKTVGPDNAIARQDFTCQQIRLLIARVIIQTGRRPRIVYVDKGTQFAAALRPYMVFLKAPGEDATQLLHRRGARAGGKVERSLQVIDLFLQHHSGYVRSSNYRRSYQRTKTHHLKTFDAFQTDFATFVHHWNDDLAPDGGSSRWHRWEQGPDMGLSPPPMFHLLAFASGERHETRQWDGGAFNIDNERWFPADPSVGVYEKLADAHKRQDEIPLIIGVISDQTFVFFQLRDDLTWHEAIRKGTSRQSDRTHQQLLNTLEHHILQHNRQRAADFFERTIRGDPARPLVLDSLSRTKDFIYPGEQPRFAQDGPASESPSQRSDTTVDLPDSPAEPSATAKSGADGVGLGDNGAHAVQQADQPEVAAHPALSVGDNATDRPHMDATPVAPEVLPAADPPAATTDAPAAPGNGDGIGANAPVPLEPPKRRLGFIARRKAQDS